jgi:hypothetical protein
VLGQDRKEYFKMSVVSVDFSSQKLPKVGAHETFCAARQAMFKALQSWILEGPDADDVSIEIDGTTNAMTQSSNILLSGENNA